MKPKVKGDKRYPQKPQNHSEALHIQFYISIKSVTNLIESLRNNLSVGDLWKDFN
jgi:hypothetical protein